MKITTLYLILSLVTLIGNYSFSQTESQKKLLHECNQQYKQRKESYDIISYMTEEKGDLKVYQLYPLFDSLALTAKNNEDYDACFDFVMAKIDNGCIDPMVLENSLGTFFRTHYPEKYHKMELAANKQFVEKSLKYYPDINLELAFTIRHLFRYDQRTKQPFLYDKDNSKNDSLITLSREQDSITQKVLKNIFDMYGYPGLSLIGTATADVYILMFHLGTDFQIEYIHLVQEAIINKQLYAEIDVLADKILHKCCNKTIYGTIWSKHSPLVTDPDEVKKLKELLKIL